MEIIGFEQNLLPGSKERSSEQVYHHQLQCANFVHDRGLRKSIVYTHHLFFPQWIRDKLCLEYCTASMWQT